MTETGQIDLARAAPFRMGPITVEPALRQVTTTSAETLEPRVMQVLVALVAARGAIVSRDDLIRRCWDGRIVGEDSISRVIARLRRLADERGDGSFRIETITKVGYRLIGTVSAVGDAAPSLVAPISVAARTSPALRRWSWRSWAVAAVAALVVASSVIWWVRPQRPDTATLAVDTFASAGVPGDTAATLRSAIVSAILPEKFRTVGGSGATADYRLTGRVARSPGGTIIFAELHAQGIAAPIWTPQYHLTATASLSGVGAELALTSRCIIEGADEPPVPKSATALAA